MPPICSRGRPRPTWRTASPASCTHACTLAHVLVVLLSASLPGIPFGAPAKSRRVRRRVRKRECVHAELWGRGRSPCPSVVGPGLYACELVGLGSGVPVGGRACPQPCLHPGVRVCNPTGGRVIVHACVQAVLRTPPLCARVVLCPRRHVRMRTATFRLGASWTKFRRSSPSRTPPPFGRGMRALVYATRHVRMGRLPAEGRVNLCSCTQLSRQKAVVPCGARAGEWRERGRALEFAGLPTADPPAVLQPWFARLAGLRELGARLPAATARVREPALAGAQSRRRGSRWPGLRKIPATYRRGRGDPARDPRPVIPPRSREMAPKSRSHGAPPVVAPLILFQLSRRAP